LFYTQKRKRRFFFTNDKKKLKKMVAFTFALLAASVQGSANILATTPEFTLRKLIVDPAGTVSPDPPKCDPGHMEKRLGFLRHLSVKIPGWLLKVVKVDENRGHDWMILPSALFGTATTVLLALKMFLFQKLISNFIAKLAILVTSAFAAWSPLQTALTQYGCAKEGESISEVFFSKDWKNSLGMLIAMPANIAAIVMTVMGFNHVITYAVAVAAYAVTFYGNMKAIGGWFCNTGYKEDTWGYQAVKQLNLEDSLCKAATTTTP
jgi:hypothetical protein